MLYLVIAIILASLLTTVYKVAGIRNLNSDNITLVNFFVAATVSLITASNSSLFSVFQYLGEARLDTVTSGANLPNTALIIFAVGLVSGVFFLVNLVIMSASVKSNGSSLSSFFKNSGFVGGVLLAVFLFREAPSAIQWIGIVLTIVALVNLIGDFKTLKVNSPQLLIFMLVAGTIIELDNKIFATYALSEYKSAMLAVIYVVAFTLCIPYTVYRYKKEGKVFKISLEEILFGCALGFSNMYNIFFKLKSLETLNASIAFPLFASGILLITTFLGIAIFKEKTSKRHIISVVIALISVALLNI